GIRDRNVTGVQTCALPIYAARSLFDALQMRLHPAASRVAKLATETPASFVAFDLLASGARDRMAAPQSERRALLEKLFAKLAAQIGRASCREREWMLVIAQ